MSAESTVAAGRLMAESLMVDAGTLSRPDGTHSTNPTTGAVTYAGSPYYSGKARIQLPNGTSQDRRENAGERTFTVTEPIVSVPMAVLGVMVGDIFTCTASELDPDLPGHVFRVTAIERKSFLTARRLVVQELTS